MLLDGLLFFAGLVVLYFGADWLIRGAASLALKFGIRPLVVGLTVVALGTSMPEFLVNFFAAVSGKDGLALGNIIGSNICNIALILGVSALVFPLSISKGALRKEYPALLAVMVGFYWVARDGLISQIDGLVLVAALFVFLLLVVIDARQSKSRSTEVDSVAAESLLPTWKKVGFLLGGMILLTAGAKMMVTGASSIAESLGISQVVVGLTVVAIGTSLPELAASVMCALRQEADLSFGNVLGSNMLNVLFVVGLIAIIQPLEVDTASIDVHFPVMIGFTLLLFPVARTQYQITRWEGGMLLSGFLGYMYYLLLPYV